MIAALQRLKAAYEPSTLPDQVKALGSPAQKVAGWRACFSRTRRWMNASLRFAQAARPPGCAWPEVFERDSTCPTRSHPTTHSVASHQRCDDKPNGELDMLASDVMTTTVVTVEPQTPVRELARLLLEHRISAVPVVDKHSGVVGIVSEGDLMRRPESGTERASSWWLEFLANEEQQAHEYLKSHGLRARDVMVASR